MAVTAALDIGQLRHRVTAETPGASVPDGDGGYTQVWAKLNPPEIWMSIENPSAREVERLFAGVVLVQSSYLLRGRWHPDLDETCRLSWVDRAGRTHVVNVTDVTDVNQEGVEMAVLGVEVPS